MNARTAIGAGCTLVIEGVVSEAPPAWLGASDLLVQATAVTTRFTNPARVIVVVLAGSEVVTADSVMLALEGATRVTEKGGAARAPRVVMAGRLAVLLYDVKPTRGGGAIAVHAEPGGAWRLAGVLAGDADPETLARTIATNGVESIAARLLLAADGAAVSVTWDAAPQPEKPSARGSGRTPTTKTSAARKNAAKPSVGRKAPARKPAGRKSEGRKSNGRKSAATTPGARKAAIKKKTRRTTSRRARTTTRGGKRNAR